ncbi:MAG: hypothetical protein ACK5Z2_07725 [Bacteroidota bacterium]|jgi:hypothetical protein
MLNRILLFVFLFPLSAAAQSGVPFSWEIMAGSSFTFLRADDSYLEPAQQLNAVSEVRMSNTKFQPGLHAGVQFYKDDTRLSAVLSLFLSQQRQQIDYYRRSFTGGNTVELSAPAAQWNTFWGNVSLRLRYTLGKQQRFCLTGGLSASHFILNQNLDTFTQVTSTTVFNPQTGQNQTTQSTRNVEFAIPLQRINFGLSGGVEIQVLNPEVFPLKLGVLYMHGFSNVAGAYYLKQQALHLSVLIGLN